VGVTTCQISAAHSLPSLGIEHAGFTVRLGSRAPPAALEPLFVAY